MSRRCVFLHGGLGAKRLMFHVAENWFCGLGHFQCAERTSKRVPLRFFFYREDYPYKTRCPQVTPWKCLPPAWRVGEGRHRISNPWVTDNGIRVGFVVLYCDMFTFVTFGTKNKTGGKPITVFRLFYLWMTLIFLATIGQPGLPMVASIRQMMANLF